MQQFPTIIPSHSRKSLLESTYASARLSVEGAWKGEYKKRANKRDCLKARVLGEEVDPHNILSYPRIKASNSSRFCSINSPLFASTLRRSSGSVLDGRTLNHQSP